MDFAHIIHLSRYQNFVFILVVYLATSSFAFAETASEIKLEHEYLRVTSRFYTELASNLAECRGRSRDIQNLVAKLKQLSAKNQNTIGICLLQNNLPLIKENIDSKEVFFIFSYLLKQNYLSLTQQLFSHAKDEGDKSLLSNISFIFSSYYAKHKKWERVLQYSNGIYNDLAFEDSNLARLNTGVALQKLKKHRESIKVYLKIPQQSKYYPAARLNIATAYIRQDWWTDAHIKINEIINSKTINTDNEMINRLYLILGYSLLRKEFYRDARDAFRNIELDSTYFNKALLGIALTATNQQDYIGALNAVNILRKKQYKDLSVDESHLLLPYIYEKLQQNMTASASYSDALKYYQQRIDKLNAIKEQNRFPIISADTIQQNRQLNIEGNIIDTSEHYSDVFLENHARLVRLEKYSSGIKSASLYNDFQRLRNNHVQLYRTNTEKLYNARLTYLNSYMNQVRFGMARLFDKSSTAQN